MVEYVRLSMLFNICIDRNYNLVFKKPKKLISTIELSIGGTLALAPIVKNSLLALLPVLIVKMEGLIADGGKMIG